MNITKNSWLKFAIWTLLYVLVFVVWGRNLWMLPGVVVIFDLCVTKYLSRTVGAAHRRAREKSSVYKTVAEWVEAILFAVVVASLVHIFVFQMYVIPSPSMEKSLLVGDYLYVSKLTYGPKMPNTPISMPLVHNTMPFSKTGAKSYSEVIKLPYKRLAGLRPIERDDVVVFNFPAGDTVLLQDQGVTYYDVERDFRAQLGAKEGRAALERKYTIVPRPVDKRENYVKRCVGLPGDSIRLQASQLYVNGVAHKEIPGMQQLYIVSLSAPFSPAVLDNMGITMDDFDKTGRHVGNNYMFLTAANLEKVRAMSNVLRVEQVMSGEDPRVFPNDNRWKEGDFGPLWIPKRGATVALTPENLPLYERIIDVYEANDLEVHGDGIYINGAPATEYTFKMDYYWMMGDNRQNSADSRFWGFVPEDHIVGKASFVWLSLDKEKGWFDGKIRWSKMFRKVR